MLSSYLFWLVLISLACAVAERVAPWRRGQRLLRPQLAQDLFWLVFNGFLTAALFGGALEAMDRGLDRAFVAITGLVPDSLRIIAGLSLPAQLLVVLVVRDFLEWCVHNLLHRVPWLWRFHRVHHSILTLDWIGNFRFHWLETIVYRALKLLPMAALGASWAPLLAADVLSTAIGHLNHSNLNISWGPLRYVLNSPRMHVWHHEREPRGRAGANFAVVFSLWDWVFGTAYMPREEAQPEEIGFVGQERVSDSLPMRFLLPFVDGKARP
ncbi:MAG: sterol desaturase family protein [Planctomycetota bacterium]